MHSILIILHIRDRYNDNIEKFVIHLPLRGKIKFKFCMWSNIERIFGKPILACSILLKYSKYILQSLAKLKLWVFKWYNNSIILKQIALAILLIYLII